MFDDDVIRIRQYAMPAWYLEWSIYVCAIVLLTGALMTGIIWYTVTLAGLYMYWNYRMFVFIRELVAVKNASEMSRLLHLLAEHEQNKHKDGTFQDSSCLTKESSDVEEEHPKGD